MAASSASGVHTRFWAIALGLLLLAPMFTAKPAQAAFSPGGANTFTSVSYTQVLSTIPAGQQKLSRTTPLYVSVLGIGGVPSSGVTAVSLDITTINSQTSSWVSVRPSDGGTGITNHFTTPGGQAQNNVYVAPGPDGRVRIDTGGESTDVVVALTGYFAASAAGGGGFVPATTGVRLLDSRQAMPIAADESVTLTTGVNSAASALAVSVTTTAAESRGYLTLTAPTSRKSVGLDYDVMSATSSLISPTDGGEFGVAEPRIATCTRARRPSGSLPRGGGLR